MLNLSGAKLPDNIKLSNYVRNPREAVRVTGLRQGQSLEIDITLNGNYTQPDKPEKAGWVGPTGLEGVHTALLTIADSAGFAVVFTNKAELRNSRGRGLTISECKSFSVSDAFVRGARTAGIAVQNCEDFNFHRPITVDTSNYQDHRTDVDKHNVAGSIKFDKCRNYSVLDAFSIDHQGNGITATESTGGAWGNPTTWGVYGANMYINASPNHIVQGGLVMGSATYRPSAYVLNSEEENEGASDNVELLGCYCTDAAWGLGVWGNEGKQGIVIGRLGLLDSLLISDGGIKVHAATEVKVLDQAGTLLLKPGALPDGLEAELRILGTALADVVRRHEELSVIAGRRAALVAALEGLRKPVEPPKEEIDMEALRALVTEGEAAAFAQMEWVKRVRAVVGE